ncbi:unnamed protein product [Ectocarpus sp. 12 AP-2014]
MISSAGRSAYLILHDPLPAASSTYRRVLPTDRMHKKSNKTLGVLSRITSAGAPGKRYHRASCRRNKHFPLHRWNDAEILPSSIKCPSIAATICIQVHVFSPDNIANVQGAVSCSGIAAAPIYVVCVTKALDPSM